MVKHNLYSSSKYNVCNVLTLFNEISVKFIWKCESTDLRQIIPMHITNIAKMVAVFLFFLEYIAPKRIYNVVIISDNTVPT